MKIIIARDAYRILSRLYVKHPGLLRDSELNCADVVADLVWLVGNYPQVESELITHVKGFYPSKEDLKKIVLDRREVIDALEKFQHNLIKGKKP